MLLTSAKVTNFKSIDDSGTVPIDADTTVMVGQNEAGKSAFLQALYQAHPIFSNDGGFDKTADYPRKNLSRFNSLHPGGKAEVTSLSYTIDASDLKVVNGAMGVEVLKEGTFTVHSEYGGPDNIRGMPNLVNEAPYIVHLLKNVTLPETVAADARNAQTIKQLIDALESEELTSEGTALLTDLNNRFTKSSWDNSLAWEVYNKYLFKRRPRFFYFDDYRLLPGKANLKQIQKRVAESESKTSPKPLMPEEQAVVALLQMAQVDLTALLKNTGYEEARANLEGVSNAITDQIFKFWRQNQQLEVVIDIREDDTDEAPFDEGPNLYIRIKNQRHRVTVPFSQRSKGFIWFFSFLVWFDSIHNRAQEQGGVEAPVILLLDEPGLNLHALAQGDLLAYIDTLAEQHQVIYTTHSPFMVRSERLPQVRVVEDKDTRGTTVSDRLDGSDPKTLFPLQAALGYTVAQNLFISKRNLVVEGIADLAYLQFFSQACEAEGLEGLRADITIVPVGGLDKVATFVSLLGANDLEIVVVHDYEGKPDARLESLVREKILRDKDLRSYAVYRDPTAKKAAKAAQASFLATDVEDLLSLDLYLNLFSATFTKELNGKEVAEKDLPQGTRIIERINRWLSTNSISLRPSSGFNHYAPAKFIVSHSMAIDADTLKRFSSLFQDVNQLFSKED
jgi:predicted ATP-dependent endonuclease of OLD family